MENIKWTEKYEPKTLNDIIGYDKEKIIIKKWINDFINEIPKCKKVLLITGKPGTGKSTFARSIFNDYKYRAKEHVCSDIKGSVNIQKIIKQSLIYTNILDCFNKNSFPIGLILDQVNILSEGGIKRSGLNDFINILKSDIDNMSKYKNKNKNKEFIYLYNPIICICNKLDGKLNKLLKYSVHIDLNEYNINDLKKITNKIMSIEKCTITYPGFMALAKYTNGDYRIFINLLEELYDSSINKKITTRSVSNIKKIYSKKNESFSINETINNLMTKKMTISESMDMFDSYFYMMPFYMYDSYLLYINKYKTSNKNKLKLYNELLDNSCKYDLFNNQLDNKYSTDYTYYSHYCSSMPNLLCSKYKCNNNLKNKIEFPKLYTTNALKHINVKYMNYDFYYINLINFIFYNYEKGNHELINNYLINNDVKKIFKYAKFRKITLNKIKYSDEFVKKIALSIK